MVGYLRCTILSVFVHLFVAVVFSPHPARHITRFVCLFQLLDQSNTGSFCPTMSQYTTESLNKTYPMSINKKSFIIRLVVAAAANCNVLFELTAADQRQTITSPPYDGLISFVKLWLRAPVVQHSIQFSSSGWFINRALIMQRLCKQMQNILTWEEPNERDSLAQKFLPSIKPVRALANHLVLFTYYYKLDLMNSNKQQHPIKLSLQQLH